MNMFVQILKYLKRQLERVEKIAVALFLLCLLWSFALGSGKLPSVAQDTTKFAHIASSVGWIGVVVVLFLCAVIRRWPAITDAIREIIREFRGLL